MSPRHTRLPQGLLDLLLLEALSRRPMHGTGVAAWIERVGGGVLHVSEGSLYPALDRLARRGWATNEWGMSENNRRAKYHRLTAAGRRQLREREAEWRRLAVAVWHVVRAGAP